MPTRIETIIVLCISLILFASCRISSYDQAASSSSSVPAASNIELVIDYGNSTQRVLANLSGSTVFDILNETAHVTYTTHAFGSFIQSINGVENNAGGNGYYWQYWVNDLLAPVAADFYVLSDGDGILWKYCAPGQTGPGLPQGMPDWWIGLVLIVGVGCALVGATVLLTRKSR